MFMRHASIVLLLLLLGGCATVGNYVAAPIEPARLPEYTLELEVRGQPEWDEDRYEVSLGFELRAKDEFSYNAVVQEIVQEVVYTRYDGREIRETLTLVEAFKLTRIGYDDGGRVVYRLPSFQRDRHYERGYLSVGPMIETVDVWRVVRFYPGYVEGADWTTLGFAHLPQNRTGSIVTDIPDNFNETHQRNHELKGAVLQDHRDNARWYHMRYRWYRESTGGRPQATFTFVKYKRPADEPEWLSNTLNHGVRHASAGE
ncbi:MAG: hypothetical protein KF696_09290 [Planctomycetes bacterium]|nr:hypothetical protein [Planctomycetota bacterium]MCW8136780.1 hypothetical protein [Planctomycetota bacterium]